MVAAPVLDKEALVVARRAERAVRKIELRERMIRGASWILDAQPPRCVVLEPAHIHVAASLNHEVWKSIAAEDGDAAIHRVALADTPKVNEHAFAPEEGSAGARVDLERPVID